MDHPRGDVHLRKIMFDLANDSDFISPQFVKALNEITIPPSFRESFYSTILPSALLLSSDFQYLGSTLSWNFLIDLLCRITDEVPPYSSSVGLYLNLTLEVGLQKKLKWMNFFHPDRERFYHHLCQLSSDEHLTLARSALSLADHQRKSSMNVVISALLHSVNYKSIPDKFQKIVELMLTQGHSAILGERINQGFDALSQIALIKFPDLSSQEQHESMIFFSYICFITDVTLQHQILSLMIDQLNLRSSWIDDLKRLIHTYTSNKNLFRKQKGFITLLHKYITDKQRHPEIQKIAKEVLPELGRLIRLGTDK